MNVLQQLKKILVQDQTPKQQNKQKVKYSVIRNPRSTGPFGVAQSELTARRLLLH